MQLTTAPLNDLYKYDYWFTQNINAKLATYPILFALSYIHGTKRITFLPSKRLLKPLIQRVQYNDYF